jgi:Fur family ferric uptake transcriptional regulator
MPRTLISDAITELLHRHHLMSAPELVTKLHDQSRKVNKTTVYRALEKLETSGVICKHNLHDNELVYELRHHHHDHLICTNCGKVEAADCQIQLPPEVSGFSVDHHHLSIYGLCATCREL